MPSPEEQRIADSRQKREDYKTEISNLETILGRELGAIQNKLKDNLESLKSKLEAVKNMLDSLDNNELVQEANTLDVEIKYLRRGIDDYNKAMENVQLEWIEAEVAAEASRRGISLTTGNPDEIKDIWASVFVRLKPDNPLQKKATDEYKQWVETDKTANPSSLNTAKNDYVDPNYRRKQHGESLHQIIDRDKVEIIKRVADRKELNIEVKESLKKYEIIHINTKEIMDRLTDPDLVELNANLLPHNEVLFKQKLRDIINRIVSEMEGDTNVDFGASDKIKVMAKINEVAKEVYDTIQSGVEMAANTEAMKMDKSKIGKIALKILKGVGTTVAITAGVGLALTPIGASAWAIGLAAGGITGGLKAAEAVFGKKKAKEKHEDVIQKAKDDILAEGLFIDKGKLSAWVSDQVLVSTSDKFQTDIAGYNNASVELVTNKGYDQVVLEKYKKALGERRYEMYLKALNHIEVDSRWTTCSQTEKMNMAFAIVNQTGCGLLNNAMETQMRNSGAWEALVKVTKLRSGVSAAEAEGNVGVAMNIAGAALLSGGIAGAIRTGDIWARIGSGALGGAAGSVAVLNWLEKRREIRMIQSVGDLLEEAETVIVDVIDRTAYPDPRVPELVKQSNLVKARLEEGLLKNDRGLISRANSFIRQVDQIQIEYYQKESIAVLEKMADNNNRAEMQIKKDIDYLEAPRSTKTRALVVTGMTLGGAVVGLLGAEVHEAVQNFKAEVGMEHGIENSLGGAAQANQMIEKIVEENPGLIIDTSTVNKSTFRHIMEGIPFVKDDLDAKITVQDLTKDQLDAIYKVSGGGLITEEHIRQGLKNWQESLSQGDTTAMTEQAVAASKAAMADFSDQADQTVEELKLPQAAKVLIDDMKDDLDFSGMSAEQRKAFLMILLSGGKGIKIENLDTQGQLDQIKEAQNMWDDLEKTVNSHQVGKIQLANYIVNNPDNFSPQLLEADVAKLDQIAQDFGQPGMAEFFREAKIGQSRAEIDKLVTHAQQALKFIDSSIPEGLRPQAKIIVFEELGKDSDVSDILADPTKLMAQAKEMVYKDFDKGLIDKMENFNQGKGGKIEFSKNGQVGMEVEGVGKKGNYEEQLWYRLSSKDNKVDFGNDATENTIIEAKRLNVAANLVKIRQDDNFLKVLFKDPIELKNAQAAWHDAGVKLEDGKLTIENMKAYQDLENMLESRAKIGGNIAYVGNVAHGEGVKFDDAKVNIAREQLLVGRMGGDMPFDSQTLNYPKLGHGVFNESNFSFKLKPEMGGYPVDVVGGQVMKFNGMPLDKGIDLNAGWEGVKNNLAEVRLKGMKLEVNPQNQKFVADHFNFKDPEFNEIFSTNKVLGELKIEQSLEETKAMVIDKGIEVSLRPETKLLDIQWKGADGAHTLVIGREGDSLFVANPSDQDLGKSVLTDKFIQHDIQPSELSSVNKLTEHLFKIQENARTEQKIWEGMESAGAKSRFLGLGKDWLDTPEERTDLRNSMDIKLSALGSKSSLKAAIKSVCQNEDNVDNITRVYNKSLLPFLKEADVLDAKGNVKPGMENMTVGEVLSKAAGDQEIKASGGEQVEVNAGVANSERVADGEVAGNNPEIGTDQLANGKESAGQIKPEPSVENTRARAEAMYQEADKYHDAWDKFSDKHLSAGERIAALKGSMQPGESIKYNGLIFTNSHDKLYLVTDLKNHKGIEITDKNIDQLFAKSDSQPAANTGRVVEGGLTGITGDQAKIIREGYAVFQRQDGILRSLGDLDQKNDYWQKLADDVKGAGIDKNGFQNYKDGAELLADVKAINKAMPDLPKLDLKEVDSDEALKVGGLMDNIKKGLGKLNPRQQWLMSYLSDNKAQEIFQKVLGDSKGQG